MAEVNEARKGTQRTAEQDKRKVNDINGFGRYALSPACIEESAICHG